ncbi:MAG: tetratricopeptide repeat protein [Bacteroidales bacterium]
MKKFLYISTLLYFLAQVSFGEETNAVQEVWNGQEVLYQQDTSKHSGYGRDMEYRKEKADGFRAIADVEKRNNNLAGALRYYLSSIYEYEIIGDSSSIARVRCEIGEIFQEGQLYDKALEYYKRAEVFFLNEGSIHNNILLLENIARVYHRKRDYQQSLNYNKRIEKLQSQGNQEAKLMETYFNMVVCWNQLGQFENSLAYNQKILDYYRKTNNAEQVIISLNNIGFAYKNLGDYENALDYFEQAFKLEKESYGRENPVTMVNLAIVYQNMDEDKKALEYLHNAARRVEKLGDNNDAAEFNHLTSVVYFNMKDYYNAQISNKEANRRANIVNNSGNLFWKPHICFRQKFEALYDYESSMNDYQNTLISGILFSG